MDQKATWIAPESLAPPHALYMVPAHPFPAPSYFDHCILRANSTAPFLFSFRSAGRSRIGTVVSSSRVSIILVYIYMCYIRTILERVVKKLLKNSCFSIHLRKLIKWNGNRGARRFFSFDNPAHVEVALLTFAIFFLPIIAAWWTINLMIDAGR